MRVGLGSPRQTPAAIAAEAATLLAQPEQIRPNRPDIGVVARFVERACVPKVGTTVERVASLADLPAAVRRYLSGP